MVLLYVALFKYVLNYAVNVYVNDGLQSPTFFLSNLMSISPNTPKVPLPKLHM